MKIGDIIGKRATHDHCWHAYQGMIHMVVPNGHVLQKCCHCEATRTVHADHVARPCAERARRSAEYEPTGTWMHTRKPGDPKPMWRCS